MKHYAKSLVHLFRHHFGQLRHIDGVEVGVWRGGLSKELMTHFPHLSLFMVDPWEAIETPTMLRQQKEIIAAREEAERVTSTYRRVICQMTSALAAAHFRAGPHKRLFNFVFIDACHLYESVKEDIDLWNPLVLPNGIICGHDYDGIGDQRHGWGVKRAVDGKFGGKVNTLRGKLWWVQKMEGI